MNYARVFFEIPLENGFDYKIPEHLKSKVLQGTRVLAPFGARNKLGYVLDLLPHPEVKDVKEILDVPDEEPILSQELLQLAQWISDYYFCPLGLVLKTFLPAPIRKFSERKFSKPPLDIERGALETPHLLNEEQQKAWEFILERIQQKDFSVSLIYGVTGSGKTELYLSSIAQVLNQNQGAIVLVPEISLTPQTVRRVRNRFGKVVALFHSRLSERERIHEWERIRRGQARVVVGPRSVIFAPIRDLGLIIVDEEHERAYKQEESPRYHARDVAIMRGKLAKIPVLLGTATPSLESYFNAQQGRYGLIHLTKRVEDRPLPKVKIVDMRREVESYGKLFNFSNSLIKAVHERLGRKEQIILFLNRRGYAPLVLCPSCGYVLSCPECDQALTYHRTKEQLLCHLCDARHAVPERCPKCKKAKLHRLGVGTQRIETHLTKLFPNAKIQRMDADSTRFKDAHHQILESFREGDVQILIGTQMIAKGLDFPNVTLVGVMSADVAMSLPDFRMGEHTFQLLTQVAGRAGRGSKLGEVLIQTFTPFHPILRAAMDQDYMKFYETEIAYRQELDYPPFSRLISIVVQGKSQERIAQMTRKMAGELKKKLNSSSRIFGPQPAPISKLKGQYRWQMILFHPRGRSFHKHLKEILDSFREEKGTKISVDVDPVSLI